MSAEAPHLQGPHKATAQLSDSERIVWIRQERWIQYPRAERILYCLADLIDYPPRDRMPSLVIYGATGMGKTRIVQKFLRDHRSRFDTTTGRTRMPVVSIQMPPAPTPQDLYEEILIGMCGIFSQRILDAIRLLANDLRVPLVCAGTHEANQALMTDQQLADRFEALELPVWENDQTFYQLLASFESILPLRQPSEFRDPKVHQRILSLTEGVLVRICPLIERAAVEAIRSGKERIELASLTEDLMAGSLVSIADRRNRRIAIR